MIKLLAKIFIKDRTNYSDKDVRQKYGVICGALGIFLNILLFAGKFIFGTIAASVAMIADAFNNLSDAASSLVQILGFKLSSKKPDPEHPFGHGRLEYIAGLIISFLICYMGIELIKSSIEAIINHESQEFNIYSVIVMIAAIFVKFYMYIYNHSIAKKINSVAMEATAKDSLSDMISTVVVIAALIGGKFTDFPVDGIGGLIVGLFIIKTGLESIKDTIHPLLGSAPDKQFVADIEKELMSHKNIVGMHDLVVHDYGPGRLMISLHAEVPGDVDIFELHDGIDIAEVDISRKFNCHVVIHMDPVDTKNERLAVLKQTIIEVCKEINPNISCHDVRMVPGYTHTNLIFDIVKPFDCNLSDDVLKETVFMGINSIHKDVFSVITIDQPMC